MNYLTGWSANNQTFKLKGVVYEVNPNNFNTSVFHVEDEVSFVPGGQLPAYTASFQKDGYLHFFDAVEGNPDQAKLFRLSQNGNTKNELMTLDFAPYGLNTVALGGASYSTQEDVAVLNFTLNGELFTLDVDTGELNQGYTLNPQNQQYTYLGDIAVDSNDVFYALNEWDVYRYNAFGVASLLGHVHPHHTVRVVGDGQSQGVFIHQNKLISCYFRDDEKLVYWSIDLSNGQAQEEAIIDIDHLGGQVQFYDAA